MFDQLVQVVFCNKKSDVLKSGAALPPENWNLPMMTIYEQWAGPCWDVVLGDETSLRWWLLWYGIIKISIHQSVSWNIVSLLNTAHLPHFSNHRRVFPRGYRLFTTWIYSPRIPATNRMTLHFFGLRNPFSLTVLCHWHPGCGCI